MNQISTQRALHRESTLRVALRSIGRSGAALIIATAICVISLWALWPKTHFTDVRDYPKVRGRLDDTVFADIFPRDLNHYDVVSFSHRIYSNGSLTELRVRYSNDAELARIIEGRDRDALAVAQQSEMFHRDDLPALITWDRGAFRFPPDDAVIIYWRCRGVAIGSRCDLNWGGVGYIVEGSARECILWAVNPPPR